MACIIAVMNANKISAKEAVLSYRKELDEEYPYDYVDLIRDGDDLEIDKIYEQMTNKNLLL
jgi:hypothetical protein